MKPVIFNPTRFFLIISFVLVALVPVQPAQASAPSSIAVLPLTINADKDLSYIRQGISRMLYSRLSWANQVQVVPPARMEQLATASDSLQGRELISQIAKETGSNYVLSGSITELAGSFSIDAKVFDIENRQYMSFFEQSEKTDDLISKVDRIAALINKKVFNRETVTWNKIQKETQDELEKEKRKNPEYLMNMPQGWQPEKKEKVGWKIWKYLF